MMHTHSLDRAARYYPDRTALGSGGKHSTFRQLHERVAGIAAALSGHGFERGDRLALLLPNEPEYLELIYACSWLGVTAVPVNAGYRWPKSIASLPTRTRAGSSGTPRCRCRPRSFPGSGCSTRRRWTLQAPPLRSQFTIRT